VLLKTYFESKKEGGMMLNIVLTWSSLIRTEGAVNYDNFGQHYPIISARFLDAILSIPGIISGTILGMVTGMYTRNLRRSKLTNFGQHYSIISARTLGIKTRHPKLVLKLAD